MIYLSLWIANLGVVPWFSFLFFLFLPIFLALRALLVLVCCVLEAIFIPFLLKIPITLMQLRTRFLSPTCRIVKVFLIVAPILLFSKGSKASKTKEYFLAKGEQIEISFKDLGSFSIGNKEVLKSRYYAAKGQLLIKGKSLGFSDLVVWNQKGEKSAFHFYVVSKRKQLTNFQLANDFKSIGLEVKALAFELLVRGELKTLEDLKLFNLYIKKNRERVVNMVELSPRLRNEIIADIYLELSDSVDSLVCGAVKTLIQCEYEGLSASLPALQRMSSKYDVRLTPKSERFAGTNFKIELKVFRLDHGMVRNMGLGLDALSAKVGRLLNTPGQEKALIEDNLFQFSQKDLDSRITTSPALLTSIGKEGEVRLGAEIPVVNQNQYGTQSTTWKFAGLELKTRLSVEKTKLALELESQLTHPAENLIRGSQSKTRFFPYLGKYTQAFQVRYDVKSSGEKKIPGLGHIPFFGALFSSSSKNSNIQWLTGYIKVTKVKE